MNNSKEVFRSLAMLTQVSLQLLIPILIGVFGGILLDKAIGSSPVVTVIGAVIGVVAAFRNLYVWSVREIDRTRKSERVQNAIKEAGLGQEPEEETIEDR